VKLVFTNPLGLFGRFATVRHVATVELPVPNSDVELYDVKGNLLGVAEFKDAWIGDLALIPASLLEMDQNPLHRTYSGLIMGLRTSGEYEWIAPETKVTCLILDFKRTSKIELLR